MTAPIGGVDSASFSAGRHPSSGWSSPSGGPCRPRAGAPEQSWDGRHQMAGLAWAGSGWQGCFKVLRKGPVHLNEI